FQYNAFLVMMLCCAAVDGAARLQKHWPARWDKLLTYPWGRPAWLRRGSAGSSSPGGAHPPRPPPGRTDPPPTPPPPPPPRAPPRGPPGGRARVAPPPFCAAALVYLPSSPFGPLLKPGFYGVNARMRAAAAAIARVPAGVEVEASNNIGPRLSGRDTVLLL